MSNTFLALWNDQKAFIVSAELVLISTLGVLGVVVGLHAVSSAVVSELNDVAGAIGAINQTYNYNGLSKWGHAFSIGSGYNDWGDYCDCQVIVDLAPSVRGQRAGRRTAPQSAMPVPAPSVAPLPAVPHPPSVSTPPCPPTPSTDQAPGASAPPCKTCPSETTQPNLSQPVPVPSPVVPNVPNPRHHKTTSKGAKSTATDKVVPTNPQTSASPAEQPATLLASSLNELGSVSSR